MAKSLILSDTYEAGPVPASIGPRRRASDRLKAAPTAADRIDAVRYAVQVLLDRSGSDIAAAISEANALLAADQEHEVDAAIEAVSRRP